MATKITVPIPQDEIKESFVWRDWFQKLSNKVYGSMASQDANAIDISGGTINGTTIGATVPSTGAFTDVTFSGAVPSTPVAGMMWYDSTTKALTFQLTSTYVINLSGTAPVTKTANFSVAATDVWLINNKSGSSCTVTLPTASSYAGRILRFQNYQPQTLISNASNVVPLVGGAAGTSILAAVAGDTCTLVSDGSNWLMTQYVPNNVLLLE